MSRKFAFCFVLLLMAPPAQAALNIPITVNLSETVNVTGTPRIAVDVGGTTRYATYTSGTGTNALTFTLAPQAGDMDLDGVTVSSPIQLNGGTMKDSKGNDATLTFTPPNTANVKVNYPSLGMDFVYDADGRYTLNGTPYNDLTSFLTATGGSFTRASIGTYFDSTGTLQTAASGVPRFDYDPVTHTAKGILIEESRTNLAKNSENIAAWNNNTSLTITSDVVTAPNGTMTADTTNSVGSTRYTVASVTSGVQYTYSFFVKPTDNTKQIYLYVDGTAGIGRCRIVPSTGVISSTSGTYNSAGITSIGNGWYRAYMVFTPTTTGNQAVHIYPLNTDVTAWWGAQLEQGAFPTSYIPTTSATVTRAADVLTIPIGSWYNASAGGIYTKFNPFDPTTAYHQIASISGADGTSDRVSLSYSNNKGRVEVGASGALSVNTLFTSNSLSSGSDHKLAMGYANRSNIVSLSGDGSMISGNGSGSGSFISPAVTLFTIGSRPVLTVPLDGWISNIKYFPLVPTNAQLQLLTQ